MFCSSIHHPHIQGIDFEWLATDAEGHVALFSNEGGVAPPELVLRNMDAHSRALQALLLAPPTTRPLFSPLDPLERDNVWRTVAERGLFAYRADPLGGPYRLAAAPMEPIRLFDLPETTARTVGAIRFKRLRFRYVYSVTAEALRPD